MLKTKFEKVTLDTEFIMAYKKKRLISSFTNVRCPANIYLFKVNQDVLVFLLLTLIFDTFF